MLVTLMVLMPAAEELLCAIAEDDGDIELDEDDMAGLNDGVLLCPIMVLIAVDGCEEAGTEGSENTKSVDDEEVDETAGLVLMLMLGSEDVDSGAEEVLLRLELVELDEPMLILWLVLVMGAEELAVRDDSDELIPADVV